MRDSAYLAMIVVMITVLLLFASLTGNRWPSPLFMALVLAGWLAYMLVRRQ